MDRTLVIRFDARTIIIVGAVLVMLAAWLPWSSLPSFLVGDLARRGFSAGGLLTFALALIVVFGLLLPWRPLRRVSLLATILAVLIDLVALVAFARGIQLSTGLEMDLGAQLGGPGSGLYLTFAGSWLMLFGGLADAEPAPGRSWLSYATWGGMLGVLLAACLCAWSIGLIARPVTLASVTTPTPTFGPAPTVYLATPLVDVQLEPLGKPGVPPAASPTLSRPGNPTSPPTSAVISPAPTARRGSPTPPLSPSATFALPTLSTPTGLPTIAIPTPSTSTPTVTPTTFTSPINTPTPTASPTITPTVTVTPTTTSTATPTVTPTP